MGWPRSSPVGLSWRVVLSIGWPIGVLDEGGNEVPSESRQLLRNVHFLFGVRRGVAVSDKIWDVSNFHECAHDVHTSSMNARVANVTRGSDAWHLGHVGFI